jgi:hypothetical protein
MLHTEGARALLTAPHMRRFTCSARSDLRHAKSVIVVLWGQAVWTQKKCVRKKKSGLVYASRPQACTSTMVHYGIDILMPSLLLARSWQTFVCVCVGMDRCMHAGMNVCMQA